MKHLRIPPLMATAAVAMSLALGGCGGSSSTMEDPAPPPPAESMPVDVEGYVTLITEQRDALEEELESGESQVLQIAPGGTVAREGVTFTCASAYPCTVTVTNSLGTIVAHWESQTLGDGTASAMATGLEPPPETDPFVELNAASAARVAAIIQDPIEDETATPPEGSANGNVSTTLGGLGLEGVGAADDSMVTLTSDLDPNNATDHTRATVDAATGAVSPAAMGGSTVAAGEMNDEIAEERRVRCSRRMVAQDAVQGLGRHRWHRRRRVRDGGPRLLEHRRIHHGTVHYRLVWHVRESMGCRVA